MITRLRVYSVSAFLTSCADAFEVPRLIAATQAGAGRQLRTGLWREPHLSTLQGLSPGVRAGASLLVVRLSD